MPVAICRLDAGESMITERGAMSWMSPNIRMETVSGGAMKALGRMFSGESFFQNRWTAQGGPGLIAFASSFIGDIIAVEIDGGSEIIIQKSAFLASTEGIQLSVYLQERLSSSFFGGEGFVMQKLSGDGVAFVEIDGTTVEYTLEAGESMIVNTGNVALMDATCTMRVERVKGVRNVLLGGEGLFNTVVTGPGRLILQTMPLNAFARTLSDRMPSK